MKKIKLLLSLYRLVPVYLLISLSSARDAIEEDADFWNELFGRNDSVFFSKIGLLFWDLKEFRNVAAYRLRTAYPGYRGNLLKRIFLFFYPALDSLYIDTPLIGKKLFIQHGFSSIIAAQSIGDECWINQQVTIGHEQGMAPRIGNHVRICAGAIIIGDITIGDNSIIAAGAVVTKDVPPNMIVGGVPSRCLKPVVGSSFMPQHKIEARD